MQLFVDDWSLYNRNQPIMMTTKSFSVLLIFAVCIYASKKVNNYIVSNGLAIVKNVYHSIDRNDIPQKAWAMVYNNNSHRENYMERLNTQSKCNTIKSWEKLHELAAQRESMRLAAEIEAREHAIEKFHQAYSFVLSEGNELQQEIEIISDQISPTIKIELNKDPNVSVFSMDDKQISVIRSSNNP